jgi:hypothetical protein
MSRNHKIDLFLDGHYICSTGVYYRCIDAVAGAYLTPDILGKIFVAKLNGGAGKITARYDKHAGYRG